MRNPVLIAASLVVGLLSLAVPVTSSAQDQITPVAVALIGETTVDAITGVATAVLDGSGSFDPDPDGGIASYKWTVVTESYIWLNISNADQPEASFTVPSQELADQYGQSIEFNLTVTDEGSPVETSVATVAYNINAGPVVNIEVMAKLLDPDDIVGYDDNQNGVVDDNAERYTLEGVIDGPGENGNADNEWHVRDGSLLEVVAAATGGRNGDVLPKSAFVWKRLYASPVPVVTASLPGDTAGEYLISTDEDRDTPGSGETAALLPYTQGDEADPYFLYYTLAVTDSHGRTTSEVVKIVILDHPADPEVEIGHPESDATAATAAGKRAGIQAAGKNRYVVSVDAAEQGVALVATGSADGRGRSSQLTHTWSGPGVAAASSNQPGTTSRATFTAPAGTNQGDSFAVRVVVADPAGRTGETEVELVVADNQPPTAVAPPDVDTPDGPNGGFPVSEFPTGIVRLRGVGFDADGDPLAFRWQQVQNDSGKEIDPTFKGPRLNLSGSSTSTVSFTLPEVTTGSQYLVYLEFEVTDRWGVAASDIVMVTIHDGDDDLKAVPGQGQRVASGGFVRLIGNISSGLVSNDALAKIQYIWAYKGIETVPLTEERIPITSSEQAQGFVAGEWFPHPDGTYHPTAGGNLKGASERYPYFDAPELGEFHSVKLTFELTVVQQDDDQTKVVQDSDTITVTVVNGFFTGAVDSPDFCTDMSLGGPQTHAFDSDGDGIADICALRDTRRATVARQMALETLAALNPAEMANTLHGIIDDPATADVDESSTGACAAAPDDLGDTEAQLAKDACGLAQLEFDAKRHPSPAPDPPDPATAHRFFSGAINGPNFCTNMSLGGATTYAFDGDGDGVADVCSLPYTKREAVARQNALNAAFSQHPQYNEALKAACAALGSLSFGDSDDSLADDECSRTPPLEKGGPLPTLAS